MKKKSLKINAILNMIKQMCAVLFPLITVPYASRILQKTNYGKYNFGQSIVSYFLLFAGLGIANYAVREGARIRDDKNKFNKFANEVFTINIISTIVSYIGLFILLIFCVSLKDYKFLILIQSFSILLVTIGADWINSIYEDYFYITIRYLIMQIMSIGCLFIFVKSPDDYIKYALITLGATYGGNCLNIFYIRKYVHLRFTWKFNFRKHMQPIFLLFFTAVVTTIYINSDITILGFLKSEAAVGIYGLSTKIYIVIKQILNSVIGVSFPRLSALLGQSNIQKFQNLSNKIIDALCTLVFPTVTGLFLLSREVIYIIGGLEYREADIALSILSIALFFAVMGGFYCCAVILPYKQEKICLIASAVSGVVNVGLNFFFIPRWSYNGAAFTTLLSELIVFVIYYIKSKKFIKLGITKKVLKSILLGCFTIIIICIFVKIQFSEISKIVFVAVPLSMAAYLFIQIVMKNYIVIDILKNFLKKIKRY